jgi:ADP-ribose pyrophosphatase YjhB (NUDIX family)
MSRDYPDRPFVGVGAIIWRGEEVLLVKRGKAPRKGEWSIPGGAQMIGETLKAAAYRESLEETGVHIKVEELVDVIDGIFPDESGAIRNHYTMVDFAATWVSGDAAPNDDVTEAVWVNLNDISDLGLWSETERVIHRSATLRGLKKQKG